MASDYDALAGVLTRRPYQGGHVTGLGVASFLLGNLLLPGVMTGLAPRRPFLWGAVPLGLMFAWSLADRIVVFNGPGLASAFRGNGIAAFILLLVVCGPIPFIRLQMRRGRDAQARRLAEYRAWAQGRRKRRPECGRRPSEQTGTTRGKSESHNGDSCLTSLVLYDRNLFSRAALRRTRRRPGRTGGSPRGRTRKGE